MQHYLGQIQEDHETVQILIRLGLWEHAKLFLGNANVTIRRSDTNIHDVIVRAYWRDEFDIVYGFYVDL